MPIDPELGFTADVIRDPSRFVGRTELIRDCILAVNSPTGLISVFGKRGVGKSSLLRQVQQIALGEYILAKRAGLAHLIPSKPRKYLTVYYSCDSLIRDGRELLSRLCNDQSSEEALFSDEIGRIVLKTARRDAEDLDVQYVDQLIPRLIEKKYGPVLERVAERQGTYEFVNPVLRQYIRLREF